jgi:hypothetical protein
MNVRAVQQGNRDMNVRAKPGFLAATLATLMVAALAFGMSSNSARANDDEKDEFVDTTIFRHILRGLGLRRDEAGIDYRERAPLVLPRDGKQLPAPENAAAASKTAAWPDDPDVKRAKQRKDAEKNRKAYVEGVDDRPLLPNEYIRRTPNVKTDNTPGRSAEESERPSTMQELGAKSIFSRVWGGDKNEYQTFTGEPPRSSLIEPPVGYRTPSPNQPFGVGKEKWVAPKIDRQEGVR